MESDSDLWSEGGDNDSLNDSPPFSPPPSPLQAHGSAATATSGGFYISSGDANSGKYGYIVVEVCYAQPDHAADYNDIEAYLPNKVVSSGS